MKDFLPMGFGGDRSGSKPACKDKYSFFLARDLRVYNLGELNSPPSDIEMWLDTLLSTTSEFYGDTFKPVALFQGWDSEKGGINLQGEATQEGIGESGEKISF
jgi:hypothetical protein